MEKKGCLKGLIDWMKEISENKRIVPISGMGEVYMANKDHGLHLWKVKGEEAIHNKAGESPSWKGFLKDVLTCSLGAYGGPEAHYGIFTEQMVMKRQYLSEEEMMELIALTGLLPGPSSTQTLVAIGYKVGGPKLAWLTMLVWAMPAVMMMTLLVFLGNLLATLNLSREVLAYIPPLAVGFIALAAWRLGRKVIQDSQSLFLFLFGGVTTYFIHRSWIFPVLLIGGGLVGLAGAKEKRVLPKEPLKPTWTYLLVFLALAGVGIVGARFLEQRLFLLFDAFYRYGYLVIGGGQVVLPMMFTELVEVRQWLSSEAFLTGFGLVQGIPGPMFSFSAYVGGQAMEGSGVIAQIRGAWMSAVALFLPGLLLIFFVYPIWEGLRDAPGIRAALSGMVPVAAGLIGSAGILMLNQIGWSLPTLGVVLGTFFLLARKKVPPPLLVAGALLLGLLG